MLAVPDPNTFEIVPWRGDDAPVARMFCDIQHLDGEPFEGDPRHVLKRNLERAREKGFTFYAGPGDGVLLLRVAEDAPSPSTTPATSTSPRSTWSSEPAQADDPHARGDGHPRRVQLPRARPEPARDRPPLHRRAHDGRQRDDVPARREGGRAATSACTRRSCRSRSRARSAPACTRTSRCSRATSTRSTTRATSTGSRRSARRSSPACCVTRARSPRSRTSGSTPTSGSIERLRGAGVRVLGAQQPLGARARAAPEEGQGELDPHRVPLARPGVQPVPRVLGDARGRA